MPDTTIDVLYAGFHLLILFHNAVITMSSMEQQRRISPHFCRLIYLYYQLYFCSFIVYKKDIPAFIANKHFIVRIRIYLR